MESKSLFKVFTLGFLFLIGCESGVNNGSESSSNNNSVVSSSSTSSIISISSSSSSTTSMTSSITSSTSSGGSGVPASWDGFYTNATSPAQKGLSIHNSKIYRYNFMSSFEDSQAWFPDEILIYGYDTFTYSETECKATISTNSSCSITFTMISNGTI
ncbi:MAG: hypothetical protein N2258_00475, partial [Brevinematales bacterium]|nr:hypothetical protein [Brevinematales bacterium]